MYQRRGFSGLGQAKIIPGIMTPSYMYPGAPTPADYQRLREAGLPIAPYIEHGSYARGLPPIMRYGLDPYRGIMGLGQTVDEAAEEVRTRGTGLARDLLSSPIAIGLAAGAVGGLLGRSVLGALAGGAVGFFLPQLVSRIR
jgi:hypothetical protein